MERVIKGVWPRRLSLGLAAATLLVIVALYLVNRSGAKSSGSPARADVGEPTYILAPDRIGDAAGKAVEAASPGWVAAGLGQEQAEQLRTDAGEVLAAIWSQDFDRYDRFARARGASLDSGASSLAQTFRSFGYRGVPDADWGTSAEQQFRYMWSHPEGRGAGWRKIGPARGGMGWYLSAEESRRGTSGQIALFAPPQILSLISKSQAGETPTAWIQMPVMFEGGCTCEVRLTFLLSPRDQRWIPVRIESIGGPCSAALLL